MIDVMSHREQGNWISWHEPHPRDIEPLGMIYRPKEEQRLEAALGQKFARPGEIAHRQFSSQFFPCSTRRDPDAESQSHWRNRDRNHVRGGYSQRGRLRNTCETCRDVSRAGCYKW